jgi:hypothetical protein
MKKARKPTTADLMALARIRECGFIGLDANGRTWLESSRIVSVARLRRLVELGLDEPNGDQLFAGIHSQTYRPRELKNAETAPAKDTDMGRA